MYYLPLLALVKNKDKLSLDKQNRIYEIYLQEMIRLSFGQAMDIAWHKGLAEANEKQYLQMCTYKTGTLARMAAKMAAVSAGASDDTVERMGRFAETIAVAFQVQDDILDLVSRKFAERKGGLGQDITEGKRSLMVIHTLEKAEPADKKRLLEILDMHTTNQKLRNEAIGIIKKYGSVKYAKWFARSLIEKGWKEIDKLLQPSDAKEKMKAFSHYLVERKI